MKILVTGGAGFIGSHTVDALLGRGDSVVCVDNLNDYYPPAIKKSNISVFLGNKKFKFYKNDITDYGAMAKIFKKEAFDAVCHLAARAGVRPSIENPFIYEEVNIRGSLNLLELARLNGIGNFVLASSSSVYGNSRKIPFSETDNVDNPISPYAATKKAVELLAHNYFHLYGLNCTCLRFFTVYGPSGRPDMAPFLFTDAIYRGREIKKFGDGTSKRDYTYVSDIVKGVAAALDKKLGYEVINLGNNSPVELNKFIAVIEGVLGKKALIKQLPKQPGDVDVTYADIAKAKKLLGYSPVVTVEDGMKKFIAWYLEKNRMRQK